MTTAAQTASNETTSTTRDRFFEMIEQMTPEEKQNELDTLMAHVIELQGKRTKERNHIAPEYVDMVAETIDQTLTDALEKIDAPQEVKDMAQALYRLESYFASIAINPQVNADEIAETYTLFGINAVVRAGVLHVVGLLKFGG